jgi:hypothetical protein
MSVVDPDPDLLACSELGFGCAAIRSEGAYSDPTDEAGGRPQDAPFSFGIGNHVWTSDPSDPEFSGTVYRFTEFLSYNTKHIISTSRQRSRMKAAVGKWLEHIPIHLAEMDPGTPTDCDAGLYIRILENAEGNTIATGAYPKTVQCHLHWPDWLPENEIAEVGARKRSIRFASSRRWVDMEKWSKAWAAAFGAEFGLSLLGPIAWLIYWAWVRDNHSDYRHTATHEVGHVLGLGHSASKHSIMWPHAQKKHYSLGEDDVRAIRSLYPEPVSLSSNPHVPQNAEPWVNTTGLYTDTYGTRSRVFDVPVKRRILAWTSIGWQEALGSFGRENGVFADVFAIGGQKMNDGKPGSDPKTAGEDDGPFIDEIDSSIPSVEAERRVQLTHQYDFLTIRAATNTVDRPPYRLTYGTQHMGGIDGMTGACAIYQGKASAIGDRVQFRCSAFHPGDHRAYSTAIVLSLPEESLGLHAPPAGEPPDPGVDHDFDGGLAAKPDIQTPGDLPTFIPRPPREPPGFTSDDIDPPDPSDRIVGRLDPCPTRPICPRPVLDARGRMPPCDENPVRVPRDSRPPRSSQAFVLRASSGSTRARLSDEFEEARVAAEEGRRPAVVPHANRTRVSALRRTGGRHGTDES